MSNCKDLVPISLFESETVKCEFKILSALCTQAINTINRARAQIFMEFHTIVRAINEIDAELLRLEKLKYSSNPIDTKEEVEDLDAKRLFRKIAKLTHPDVNDDTDNFIAAKKALRNGDIEKLKSIYAQCTHTYTQLLIDRKRRYNDIVSSEEYVLSKMLFDESPEIKGRARLQCQRNLIAQLQEKQKVLLMTKCKNPISFASMFGFTKYG